MSFGELILSNLLSPIVLAFVLGVGVGAALVKSDLRLPDPVHAVLSIYLLLAIGLKGSVELRQAEMASVVMPLSAAHAHRITLYVAAVGATLGLPATEVIAQRYGAITSCLPQEYDQG